MAKACNADVEAEIGIVTGHEGKTFAINDVSDAYTDPELAARYVKDTGIDAWQHRWEPSTDSMQPSQSWILTGL